MLVQNSMDTSRGQAIKEHMERAFARRLQPHFIQAFFLEHSHGLAADSPPRSRAL